MGWSYKQGTQSDSGQDTGSGTAVNGKNLQPRGNAAAQAALASRFAEQDYGILSDTRTEQAISWNNDRALDALPDVLSARGLSSRPAYDTEVVDSVAEFQENLSASMGLSVDGKVGPSTLAHLQSASSVDAGEVDASVLWPEPGASIEEQYAHFSELAALFGSSPQKGQPLLIGLRGVMEGAGATHQGGNVKAYDDTYVLLMETDEGVGVRTFSGATHAYQAASGASPNADGRGQSDVGSVRPTHDGEHYELSARDRRYHGKKSLAVNSDPTEWGAASRPSGWVGGHVPMHRDTNQDRTLSDAEQTASEQRTPGRGRQQVVDGLGDFGTVVWFHPGLDERKANGRGFSSIGCLTARREDVDNLHALAGSEGNIRLIIVEAQEAVRRMGARPVKEG